jgi:hypothetical protein
MRVKLYEFLFGYFAISVFIKGVHQVGPGVGSIFQVEIYWGLFIRLREIKLFFGDNTILIQIHLQETLVRKCVVPD